MLKLKCFVKNVLSFFRWNPDLKFSIREEVNHTSYSATKGQYENYRDTNLPDGYTAYEQKFDIDVVYDKYDYDYGESSDDHRSKPNLLKRFRTYLNDMGWLNLFCSKNIQLLAIFCARAILSLYKGPSINSSKQCSELTIRLLCNNPRSSTAQKFQE